MFCMEHKQSEGRDKKLKRKNQMQWHHSNLKKWKVLCFCLANKYNWNDTMLNDIRIIIQWKCVWNQINGKWCYIILRNVNHSKNYEVISMNHFEWNSHAVYTDSLTELEKRSTSLRKRKKIISFRDIAISQQKSNKVMLYWG